jgi:hypothetical protein
MTNLRAKQQNAARKRRQRARQTQQFGLHRIEVLLSDREFQMLESACVRRNPGREPYSKNDYIALLIFADGERLERQESALGVCNRCKSQLPGGCAGTFKGESSCWLTRDCRTLNLTDVTGHARLDEVQS